MQENWWRDRAALDARFSEAGNSWAELSRRTGVAQSTLKSAAAKLGVGNDPREERPGFTVTGDLAVFVSEAKRGLQPKDVEALLAERNIDLGEWEVDRLVVNEWESMTTGDDGPVVVPLRQLKCHLKRRVPLEWVFPAVEVRERKPPKPVSSSKPRLVWVAGDQQAPYHDPELHAAVCRWLADVQPDEGVLVGDTCDFPTISRHGDNPNWSAPVQECLNAGYRLLSDYRDMAPTMPLRKLRGNHDWRMESELLARAERMFGIRPADIPGEEQGPHALSLRRLLHLDALHIELCGQEGDHWKFGQVTLAPNLVVRHDGPPPKNRRVKADVISGHDHRQSIVHTTEWDDDEPVTRTLMRVGTLARLGGGLGYATDPDWQQGMGTVAIHPDGSRMFELAAWRGGRLHWRGGTW